MIPFGRLLCKRYSTDFLIFCAKFFPTLFPGGSLYKYKGKQNEESEKGKGDGRGIYRKDDGTDV